MLQKGGVTLRTPCQLADLRGAVGKNDKPGEKSELLFRYYRVLVFHFKLIFFFFIFSFAEFEPLILRLLGDHSTTVQVGH
jgi:hypothetical protein